MFQPEALRSSLSSEQTPTLILKSNGTFSILSKASVPVCWENDALYRMIQTIIAHSF